MSAPIRMDPFTLTFRAIEALDQLRRDYPHEYARFNSQDAVRAAERAQKRGRRDVTPRKQRTRKR